MIRATASGQDMTSNQPPEGQKRNGSDPDGGLSQRTCSANAFTCEQHKAKIDGSYTNFLMVTQSQYQATSAVDSIKSNKHQLWVGFNECVGPGVSDLNNEKTSQSDNFDQTRGQTSSLPLQLGFPDTIGT